MNIQREIGYTFAAITVAFAASVAFLTTLPTPESGARLIETILFTAAVLLLLWGNFVYQFARLGYLTRLLSGNDRVAKRVHLADGEDAPRVTVLIPSYKEEPSVLLQTLLSAALLQYPNRNVVVLLDDPPVRAGPGAAMLEHTRALVWNVQSAFCRFSQKIESCEIEFRGRVERNYDCGAEQERLAALHDELASWIESWGIAIKAYSQPSGSHVETWFEEKILRGPARAHCERANELRAGSFDVHDLAMEYRRLRALTSVDVRSFERKRYVNLSHAPNKAMNLNSYIALLGGHYREADLREGLHLVPCPAAEASLSVPAPDYILTLDADSVVLSDYASRLVAIMEQDPQLAVAQTPYSAFPDPPGLLERVAGATTDVQYVVHQGFTRFNATYWVGANAMLRYAALHDIRTTTEERGHTISVFIQDRTVIEDTGSTIDLVMKGWRLYNHPERLAYSATPADFGALLIQRRRWANGGLIILPDLLRHLRRGAGLLRALPEAVMRSHYLCSPAVAGFGILLLLLFPFDDSLTNVWLPVTAAPYFWLYGRDLRLSGYRWLDLLRVYSLNLLLIPVTLAGVLRSLQQGLTGRKPAFGRTPKIGRRTATPGLHVALQWSMPAYLLFAALTDLGSGQYVNAAFSLGTTLLMLYGITKFVGWRDSAADLRQALHRSFARRQPVSSLPSPHIAVSKSSLNAGATSSAMDRAA